MNNDIKYRCLFEKFVGNEQDLCKVLGRFDTYYHELIDYNQKVNLTAITEEEEVYIKHFYDSCLAQSYLPSKASVADIGTGAGFPGLPLKIIRPDINLHFVDSLNKRIVFLDQLKQKLGLNYNTYHSRAEDFCTTLSNRNKFDVVVSRAVAKLNTLSEYCLPLLKIGGIFIAYKAGNINDELSEAANAISVLGGQVDRIETIELPNNMGTRNLIIIKKIKNTPNKYPRNKNLPKTNPL